MLPKDNYYIGFLTNVDSSILKVKLEHGFTIEGITIDKYEAYLDSFKIDEVFYEIHKSYLEDILSPRMPIVNKEEEKLYFIKNTAENYKKYYDYPYKIVNLLRLFKEGNLWISVEQICKKIKKGQDRPATSSKSTMLHIRPFPKYILTDSDIQQLNDFLKNFKIPFEKSYLQLAFDNLELSYSIYNRNLTFLTLMIGFEALFNQGGTELTQTVSRHTAMLLSEDKNDFERIYNDMREFYVKRSHIVHAVEPRKRKPLEDNNITKLRNYLRECIKEVYSLNCEKKELYEMLNSRGF